MKQKLYVIDYPYTSLNVYLCTNPRPATLGGTIYDIVSVLLRKTESYANMGWLRVSDRETPDVRIKEINTEEELGEALIAYSL